MLAGTNSVRISVSLSDRFFEHNTYMQKICFLLEQTSTVEVAFVCHGRRKGEFHQIFQLRN